MNKLMILALSLFPVLSYANGSSEPFEIKVPTTTTVIELSNETEPFDPDLSGSLNTPEDKKVTWKFLGYDQEQVGSLTIAEGVMTFEGNTDESAAVFMHEISERWNWLKDEICGP
jgi:hypothetical protein